MFLQTSVAQTPKVDTVVVTDWSGTDWVNDSRTISSYDLSCRLSSALNQYWDETSEIWNNQSLQIYSYKTDNYISDIVIQIWNTTTNSWNNSSRDVYTYDNSFKVLSLNSQYWQDSEWKDGIVTTYSYDENGNYDSILVANYYFDPLGFLLLATYTNNSDGTPKQVVHQSKFGADEWQNVYRETFTYNTDQSVNTNVTENWISNSWQNGSRITYSYNATGKTIKVLTESFYPGQWTNSSQTIYSYDNNDYIINILDQTWSTNVWENIRQLVYINNTDGTVKEIIHQSWTSETASWANGYKESYTYITYCTLPLKLISFTATLDKTNALLNWQTADELNTSHFNIQRSLDGTNFIDIGKVTAKGSSNQSYGFTENLTNLLKDKFYYRLQILDKDGKFSFSNVVLLALQMPHVTIKISPNPVKDQLHILFDASGASKATLRILDATGKIMHIENLSVGINTININVSQLGDGIYYVQLITDKGIQRTSFMKSKQ